MTPPESAFTDTLISRTVRERIVVVGVTFPGATAAATEAGLDELALLVDTAGADVLARIVQRRTAPDPATYVGRGKADELRAICLEVDADTVVFDDDLSPAQQRNLESMLGRTAIDRTAVILDIFAQNARTPEGRAQVELALLRYRLPRLRGRGTSFSQQAGGIGTRGPGETQLEVDRRRLVRRMARLESDLRQLDRTRRTQRKGRARSRHRTVSLVGYTNAGKSTLLNQLCGADVLVENRLFSTLDPRTRQLVLPGGETILLTDTVGFVRKLPHQVVEAFRSTLEVVRESDLIVHLVDGSAPDLEGQIDAVRTVLAEIGLLDRPTFTDFRNLIIYGQRTGDGRIAFGGRGAPYHFGSAIRPDFDTASAVHRALRQTLVELFPVLDGVEITHRWGGPLGVPRDWFPSVSYDRTSGIARAGGYVGDGVATTNLAGRTLAELISGVPGPLAELPWVGHRSPTWESEPLRYLGINAGLVAMTLADHEESLTGRPSAIARAMSGLLGH